MTALASRFWSQLTTRDFTKLDPAATVAVLPLGATEQHGPHLPVGTDVMIAQAYLARVRELLPDSLPATFLPIQPIGISTEHIGYPGTLTLPELGFEAVDGASPEAVRCAARLALASHAELIVQQVEIAAELPVLDVFDGTRRRLKLQWIVGVEPLRVQRGRRKKHESKDAHRSSRQ